MSSAIDICNLALSRLGAQRITSFSDDTIEAQECDAIYAMVTEDVQSMGPWMCQKFRVALPQVTAAPAFGFNFAYQLPVSPLCLRVLKFDNMKVGDSDFQIENNLLLTNNTFASILYMGLVTDEQAYDPYLKFTIVDFLAAQMAYKITGSIDTQQKLMQYAEQKMGQRLTLSGLQGSPDTLNSDTFVDIRFSEGNVGGSADGPISLGQIGDQGVSGTGS